MKETDPERVRVLRRHIKWRLDQGWGSPRWVARLYLRLTNHPRYR